MKNGISILGGLQKIRQAAEEGTSALSAKSFNVPSNGADYALSHTQAWTTIESKDAFIDDLNDEFNGSYDFCFSEFGGETILEITGM